MQTCDMDVDGLSGMRSSLSSPTPSAPPHSRASALFFLSSDGSLFFSFHTTPVFSPAGTVRVFCVSLAAVHITRQFVTWCHTWCRRLLFGLRHDQHEHQREKLAEISSADVHTHSNTHQHLNIS